MGLLLCWFGRMKSTYDYGELGNQPVTVSESGGCFRVKLVRIFVATHGMDGRLLADLLKHLDVNDWSLMTRSLQLNLQMLSTSVSTRQ